MFNVLGIQWGSIKHNIQPDAAYSLTYPTQIFFFVKFSSVISYLGPIILRKRDQARVYTKNEHLFPRAEAIRGHSLVQLNGR